MHGLVPKAAQCFLTDTYGAAMWASVAAAVGLDNARVEALSHVDDTLVDGVFDAAARQLRKPREALLEDMGLYIASRDPLRRLLRFGGANYEDFLHSLDELPDRVRLAVPDFDLPELRLETFGSGHFELSCISGGMKLGAVFAGIIRAMADDYGSLVVIEESEDGDSTETIKITLLDACFTPGRDFELAQRGAR